MGETQLQSAEPWGRSAEAKSLLYSDSRYRAINSTAHHRRCQITHRESFTEYAHHEKTEYALCVILFTINNRNLKLFTLWAFKEDIFWSFRSTTVELEKHFYEMMLIRKLMKENVLRYNDAPVRVSAGREKQLLGREPLSLSVWMSNRNRQNMHNLQRG